MALPAPGTGVLVGVGVFVGGAAVLVAVGVFVGGTVVLVGVGVAVAGTVVLVGVGVAVAGTVVLVGVGVFVAGTVVLVGVGVSVAGTVVLVGVGVSVDGTVVLVGVGVGGSAKPSQVMVAFVSDVGMTAPPAPWVVEKAAASPFAIRCRSVVPLATHLYRATSIWPAKLVVPLPRAAPMLVFRRLPLTATSVAAVNRLRPPTGSKFTLFPERAHCASSPSTSPSPSLSIPSLQSPAARATVEPASLTSTGTKFSTALSYRIMAW
jgi:hypothetical protein